VIVVWPAKTFIKYSKIGLAIGVLAIIAFYLLPKFIALLGNIQETTPKIRDHQLLEKPLRVFLQF
jgi:hypothetical protein